MSPEIDTVSTEQQLRDVSAQLELERSHLADVLDKMQESVIAMSFPDRKLVFASASFSEIFGYPLQNFIDDPQFFHKVVHPDDLAMAVESMQRCIREGFTELEHRIVLPSGEVRWLHRRAWMSYDAVGRPLRVTDTARDITQRKLTEQALRASEERYRSLIEAEDAAIALLSPDGRLLYVNQVTAGLYGRPAQELTGIPAPSLFASGQTTLMLSDLERVTSTGEGLIREVAGSIGGREQWYRLSLQPVRDENNQPFAVLIHATNISESKRAAHAILASQRRLMMLVERAPAAIAMLDRDMRYIAVSHRYLTDYKIPYDNVVGMSHYDVFPELPLRWKESHQRCLNGSVERSESDVFRRADGAIEWVRWELQPWYDESGQIGGMVLFSELITTQKKAEIALREAHDLLELRVAERTIELARAKARMDAIFDHSGDGILLIDRDKVIQEANYAFAELVGSDAAVCRGESLPAFFVAEDHPLIEQVIHDVCVSHVAQNIEARAQHEEGRILHVEMSIAPVNRSDTAVSSLVCIIRDVTERHRAEAKLETLTRRLQLATETGGIGIWDWDMLTDELVWDEQMFALHGITREEFTGLAQRTWTDRLIHPDDFAAVTRQFEIAILTENTIDSEYRVCRADGDRYLKVKAVVFRDAQLHPVRMLGVNWDITLLKQAEKNLRLALEKEKELGDLKSRFVSMASHEFRNPLASIHAVAETLSNYRDRMTTEQIEDRLARIRYHVMHMKDIMEDVLQLARLQSKVIEFKPTLGSVDRLVGEIVDEFNAQADYEGRVVYSPPKSSVEGRFDPRLLRQIISNLIHNGLKYSAGQPPVEVRLKDDDNSFMLTVRDHGIGIPEADLPHLFEPFHRASNASSISGTGLGLSITKQAVDAHSGAILVESKMGVGTTFTLMFLK